MSTFCPFMSNAQGKVACDTDCQLYWEEEDGLQISGKAQSGCSQRLSVLAIAKIEGCRTAWTDAFGNEAEVISTLDRSLTRAMNLSRNKDYIALKVKPI